MLELFLVRHGQTDYSRANRFCGWIDPPLNSIGQAMADALGAAYASMSWTAIYSSPSLRARQTANALARRVGLEPILDDGLREISYGDWDGLNPDEAKARTPEAYAYWSEDSASHPAPGGETAFQVAARAALALERIRRAHRDGRVLVVSHKATLRICYCTLMELDVRRFRDRFTQSVCAITKFELGQRGPLLALHGDISHLPPELRNQEGT